MHLPSADLLIYIASCLFSFELISTLSLLHSRPYFLSFYIRCYVHLTYPWLLVIDDLKPSFSTSLPFEEKQRLLSKSSLLPARGVSFLNYISPRKGHVDRLYFDYSYPNPRGFSWNRNFRTSQVILNNHNYPDQILYSSYNLGEGSTQKNARKMVCGRKE